MAVQVPKLQRLAPSATLPANSRISVQARDTASDITGRTNAVAAVASEGLDIYQEYENDKITQLSQEAEIEYKTWNDQELRKLKSFEGDPTDAYAEYEKIAVEKYDEIINKRPDLNTRVKDHLSANLSKVARSERVQVLNQRGMQQETYASNLYESTVKLKKDNLGTTAGYIRKGDPSSFTEMDNNINDIVSTISTRSLDKGLATKTEDGKVVLGDIAKQRVAKELSEGVSASLKSMLASGYSEDAQYAYEKYSVYLDPKAKTDLQTKFRTVGIKQTAFDEIGKIEGKSESEQIRAIEAIQDPEVKSEALKIKDTNDRRRENIKKRKEDTNFDYLGSHVLARMNSSNPFNGPAELENDPKFKAAYDNLDVQGKKAIMEMVTTPKETNTQAEIKMQNLIFGENTDVDIASLTPTQFSKYTVGLSNSDKKKYTNMYNKIKNPTDGAERASYKAAGAILQEQFIIDGHIEKNKFGKISGDDEITYLAAKNRMIDAMDKEGPKTPKELREFVQRFSAEEIKGKVYNPQPKKPFNAPGPSTPTASPVTPVSPKNQQIVLSPKDLLKYQKAFKKQYGTFGVTSDPKFMTFVQNNQL